MINADDTAQRLIRWQRDHGRHDLPWQEDPSPYRVWVSEIMLQQTQVTTVIPYFRRFVERLPILAALANAHVDEVLALWSGLGYYSRARNLHRAAIRCLEAHGGELPETLEALMELPGIGRSTAGAILALSRNQPHPILDGNAKRVLARLHCVAGWPGESAVSKELWRLAEAHTPARNAAAYTQAIMDLGASVCTRRRPACATCPLTTDCLAYQQGNPEAYPGRRPRRDRPHRQTLMLILRDASGRVLLERRPPAGVWGGLWSLPEATLDVDPGRAARELLGVEIAAPRTRPTLRHGFTHFTLDIHALAARVDGAAARIMDAGERRWLAPAEALEAGLPRPVRTLLEREFEICNETRSGT